MKKNNNNNKADRFSIYGNKIKFAKNLRKFKSQKLSEFQKIFKFKKLSKIEIYQKLILEILNSVF